MQKETRLQSKSILASAQGELCTINSEHCNHNPETTVCAHANWPEHGKGMGRKAHDIFVAYACSDCHAWLDSSQATREEKRDAWMRGHAITLMLLVRKGLVAVKR
jgi:hypothetical protein